jgi:hypothetical protein
MTRSPRPRKTATLPESVYRQLNKYALAASAAGVSVLALVQPAEAKIIYTYAHKSIGPKIFLDLNHDGVFDFKFINGRAVYTFAPSTWAWLDVYGVRPANQIEGRASALLAGAYIGPKGTFSGGEQVMATVWYKMFSQRYQGPWVGATGAGVKHRYLGLRFGINGKIHFGWARLDVIISRPATIQATLTGYAYETIPGKAIIAGATKGPDDPEPTASLNAPASEPATLGMLALGAPGLSIWRRRESVSAAPESN